VALTEDELILSARSGNMQAYESLVRSYQNLAWKTALVILRHPDDAEDAVQSALVKAWQHLDSFRAGSPFRPWLLRIVANEAKNLRLSRQRKEGRTADIADHHELRAADPDPERSLLIAERSRELVRLINELPETDRLMIHCRYVLQLSEPEIADVLEIARGTVKSRLHRAIARLREIQETNNAGSHQEVIQ
jgi:RNA polymerase sigma-70 factor (ECF subfamily)